MSSENQTYTLQNRLWFIIVLLIHSTSQLDMYQIHRKQQIFRSKSSTKCLYHLTNALVDLLCHCLANFYSTRDSKIHYIRICHNYLVLINIKIFWVIRKKPLLSNFVSSFEMQHFHFSSFIFTINYY